VQAGGGVSQCGHRLVLEGRGKDPWRHGHKKKGEDCKGKKGKINSFSGKASKRVSARAHLSKQQQRLVIKEGTGEKDLCTRACAVARGPSFLTGPKKGVPMEQDNASPNDASISVLNTKKKESLSVRYLLFPPTLKYCGGKFHFLKRTNRSRSTWKAGETASGNLFQHRESAENRSRMYLRRNPL